MCARNAYRDQGSGNSIARNHRYYIQKHDFSRLWRGVWQAQGINVGVAPELNVDHWMDPESKDPYAALIQKAVFHYQARRSQADRFMMCIATSEMRADTWKYVHKKQLILDGTFGLCSSRLLLWIAMGVDDNKKGVPVAFFLFSAPTGTRATHAGYNSEILGHLFDTWKTSMSVHPVTKETFHPTTAITDCDFRERAALHKVWPSIQLLLCKFHLRQCWTNKRKQVLKGLSPSFWTTHAVERIHLLEKE
jgi:hypothetical protein